MRIVQVIDSRDVGGIETHVATLAKSLDAAGEDVSVLFVRRYGAPHPLESVFECAKIKYSYANGVAGLFQCLRASTPDVVHSHGYKANLLCRAFAVAFGIPIVASFHAGEPGSGRVPIYTALDRWSAVPFQKIAVSNAIKASLRGSCQVVDNFIETTVEQASLRTRRIVFVGRLSHEKGPDLFCEVAKSLRGIKAHVYGDGPLRTELEQAFGTRIKFHGTVGDIGQRLMECDLVVMPSRHEGLPMAALEAMARGVPVAAFAVGGLPDLINSGGNGLLASPNDIVGLRTMIEAYFDAPMSARLALGRAARETIKRSYATSLQTPKIQEIYRDIVSKRMGGQNACVT